MSILSGSSNVLLHIFVYLSDSPLAYVGLAYLCLHPAPCLGTGTWKQAKAIIAYWQIATIGGTGTEAGKPFSGPLECLLSLKGISQVTSFLSAGGRGGEDEE